MSKLTRATVPMCPECGAELHAYTIGMAAVCPHCDRTIQVVAGYHAPDVEAIREVVREMEALDGCCWCGDCYPNIDKQEDVGEWKNSLEAALKG